MAYIRNSILLFIIVVFTVFAIWWSNTVQLDEFSRMQGKIIPSTKEKVIQSEFSGRLISLNVTVGQYVLEGSVLAKVQDEELLTDLEIKNEEVKRGRGSFNENCCTSKKSIAKI